MGRGCCAEMTCQPGCVASTVFFCTSIEVVCTGLIRFSCKKGDSFQASASSSMLCCWSMGMTGRGASKRRRRFCRYSMTIPKHAGLKSRKNRPNSSRGTSAMNSSLNTRLKTLPSMLQSELLEVVNMVPEQLISMISVSTGHISFIFSLSLSSRFHSASIFVFSLWHQSSVSCRSRSSSLEVPSRSCWICCHVARILSRSLSTALRSRLKEGSMSASVSMARRNPPASMGIFVRSVATPMGGGRPQTAVSLLPP
mmetsp:Transcript_19105/g.51984  ORF Transcript_19105/g.51984 Transcript_19105/m.51984 type:complete len:254 (-) Transcript_19105:22-783(-)